MGFGPGTVAVVAEVLGEPPPDLESAARRPGQSRLEDAAAEPQGDP